MSKKESTPMTPKKLLEWIVILILILLLAIIICGLIQQFVITPIRVEGGSMYPTINETGDKVYVYRKTKTYKIGDVIVFYKLDSNPIENNDESKNPSSKKVTFSEFLRALPIIGVRINTSEENVNAGEAEYKAIIKRIVACPGDTVEFVNGELYINNEKNYEYSSSPGVGDNYKHTMERDEYFVLGDNREHSNDSEDYGPIKKSMIYGKAVLLIKNGRMKLDF